jgi:hypothetical protein
MKFTKEEKKFWKTHYHIDTPSQLHENWEQIWSVDNSEDDGYFYFFTLRVTSIVDIYLKSSLITDKAVEYMTKFKELQYLVLRQHKNITKASIPFFNQMEKLESLNITKTKITLTDLCEHLNNQSIREVFLDSEENEDTKDNILEKAFILKERMPNCDIYLDTSDSTNEKPIF